MNKKSDFDLCLEKLNYKIDHSTQNCLDLLAKQDKQFNAFLYKRIAKKDFLKTDFSLYNLHQFLKYFY